MMRALAELFPNCSKPSRASMWTRRADELIDLDGLFREAMVMLSTNWDAKSSTASNLMTAIFKSF